MRTTGSCSTMTAEVTEPPSRVLNAIAQAAAELTDAGEAAVVAARGDEIVVVAVAGARAERTVGQRLTTGDDALSFALAGGQSLSVGSSTCVPCLGADGVLGALALRGGPAAGSFGVEATRTATLLAAIAAAHLEEGGGYRASARTPSELGAELAELAASDTSRYDAIASALETLLAGG